MSYMEKIEKMEEEDEANLYLNMPGYRFYNESTDNNDDKLVSFGFRNKRGPNKIFPEYTASLKYREDSVERWAVQKDENRIEFEINSNHSSKEELSYKLENTYDYLVSSTS